MSRELSDLVVYCKSVHFHSFKESRSHGKCYEMSSFAENKAKKLAKEEGFVVPPATLLKSRNNLDIGENTHRIVLVSLPSAVLKPCNVLRLRDEVCAVQHEAAEQDLSQRLQNRLL